MKKRPRLGKLYSHPPRWWHQAEPATVKPESFKPRPAPSAKEDEEARLNKLAEIALHERDDKHHKPAA